MILLSRMKVVYFHMCAACTYVVAWNGNSSPVVALPYRARTTTARTVHTATVHPTTTTVAGQRKTHPHKKTALLFFPPLQRNAAQVQPGRMLAGGIIQ
jgi:hypothetical protein